MPETALWLIAILCATVLPLAACSRTCEMWVVPGATVEDLTFGIGAPSNRTQPLLLISVHVYRCRLIHRQATGAGDPRSDEVVWISELPAQGHRPTVSRITYGQDEPGLRTEAGPAPLARGGCYVVHAYAVTELGEPTRGTLGFSVESSGKVRELSNRELNRVLAE